MNTRSKAVRAACLKMGREAVDDFDLDRFLAEVDYLALRQPPVSYNEAVALCYVIWQDMRDLPKELGDVSAMLAARHRSAARSRQFAKAGSDPMVAESRRILFHLARRFERFENIEAYALFCGAWLFWHAKHGTNVRDFLRIEG